MIRNVKNVSMYTDVSGNKRLYIYALYINLNCMHYYLGCDFGK